MTIVDLWFLHKCPLVVKTLFEEIAPESSGAIIPTLSEHLCIWVVTEGTGN